MSDYHCPKHGVRWWDFSQDASKPDLRCIKCEIERAELAESQLQQVKADAESYKRRLAAMFPLFEEARDALVAIPLASAKLHNVRLDLADRMDDVGDPKRWAETEARGNDGTA